MLGLAVLSFAAGCANDVTNPPAPSLAPTSHTAALAQIGTVVYNNIPSQLPGNVPSQGFQCCQTAEFGDNVELAGTARRPISATVLMSDWAMHSTYPDMPAAGYTHPITLNIYAVTNVGGTPALGALLGTVAQSFLIPWRPEPTPSCGTAWKASNGTCYNGFAFTITFDLTSLSIVLPNDVIVGVAYNTNSWGYHPLGIAGPYESLNVGTVAISPSVGTDVEPDAVFWNTGVAAWYSDGGTGGVSIFRRDTGWTGYAPSFSITAGNPVATTKDACKGNGWQTLGRTDGSTFKNQGDCVQFVNTGK